VASILHINNCTLGSVSLFLFALSFLFDQPPPQILELVTATFKHQINRQTNLFLQIIQEIQTVIEEKLKASNLSDLERQEKIKRGEEDFNKLKNFDHFDLILEEANLKLDQACEKFYEVNKTFLVEKIQGLAEDFDAGSSYEEEAAGLEEVVSNTIINELLKWEGDTTFFASLKKTLILKLKEVSAEFSEMLLQVGSHEEQPFKKDSNSLPKGFTLPKIALSLSWFGAKGAKRRELLELYSKDLPAWRKKYALEDFHNKFTVEFLREKAEEFIFSPAHYVRNLKEGIKAILASQEARIKDMRDERRAHEDLKYDLNPLLRESERIRFVLETFENPAGTEKVEKVEKVEKEKARQGNI